jgi:hypothetical protein
MPASLVPPESTGATSTRIESPRSCAHGTPLPGRHCINEIRIECDADTRLPDFTFEGENVPAHFVPWAVEYPEKAHKALCTTAAFFLDRDHATSRLRRRLAGHGTSRALSPLALWATVWRADLRQLLACLPVIVCPPALNSFRQMSQVTARQNKGEQDQGQENTHRA